VVVKSEVNKHEQNNYYYIDKRGLLIDMLKEELEQDCEKAIQQIEEKMYAKEYEDEYEEVFCYGISFYKKRCMIENLKENGNYQI
jgi:predicted component of type VI protein secretion system